MSLLVPWNNKSKILAHGPRGNKDSAGLLGFWTFPSSKFKNQWGALIWTWDLPILSKKKKKIF
jgi:hypothetical protein